MNPKALPHKLEYVIVILTIYLSGSIFAIDYYYKEMVIIYFITILFLVFIYGIIISVTTKHIAALVLLFSFIIFTLLINHVTTFSSYVAIALQLVSALIVARIIPEKNFCEKYVNVMCIMAFISLVCYFTYVFYPDIASYFPMSEGHASVDYYNAGVYVFMSPKGYGEIVAFARNNGIFWEPGVYQAFLNIALLMLLDNMESPNYRIKNVIILMATIITTYSTTGYLLLLLIIILKRDSIGNLRNEITKRNVVIMLIGALLLGVAISKFDFNYEFLKLKFSTEFFQGSWKERLNISDVDLLFSSLGNFLGISFETYADLGRTSGNSLLHTMITLGIPFTITLLGMYYSYCKKQTHKICRFLIFMAIFVSESTIWRPFFLWFAWHGLNDGEAR